MNSQDVNLSKDNDPKASVDNINSGQYEKDYSDAFLFADEEHGYDFDSPILLEQEMFLPDSFIDSSGDNETWKILVVDDEESVHAVTRIALEGFTFKDRPIEFLNAYTAEEAKEFLNNNADIALVFLDVVMEKNDSGLEIVKYIREELLNPFVRIILRTAHPGYAPERDVIRMYEINDYKNKSELSADKIFTITLSGLRTYDSLLTVETYRRELEMKVKERTSEIEAQRIQLQALNAIKDKLFSVISFDLKNPISTLLIFLEILSDDFEKLNREELKDIISSLDKSLKQSFDLLENLTQWSKAKTGLVIADPEIVDLQQIVQNSIFTYKKFAEEKNVHITNLIPENKLIFADPRMLHIVLKNIIFNAIKYSYPNGDVILECLDLPNFVEVRIKDKGTGISPDFLSKLFKIEHHFSLPGTSGEQGAGLGLLVSRDFVGKNGGILYIESFEGKGTTVKFTIPANNPKTAD